MMKVARKSHCAFILFAIGTLHLLILHRWSKTTFQHHVSFGENELVGKPPTNIVVLGERTSGVNYAAEILGNACSHSSLNSTISTILHKHIFRHDLLDHTELNDIAGRPDILWIMVVRSPCDWADALIRLQKRICLKQDLPVKQKNLCNGLNDNDDGSIASEEEYYRMPWSDWEDPNVSYPDDVIIASKPDQNSKYNDIFHMRKQKLMIMKQIMELVPRHVKILRLSEFELNPHIFVKVCIITDFRLPIETLLSMLLMHFFMATWLLPLGLGKRISVSIKW